MQIDHYIRPRQLAEAIGVSESSLKRWTDRGLLPTVKTVGGHRRLPIWGVVDFLRRSGHPVIRPELLGLPVPAVEADTRSLAACLPIFRELLLGGHVDEGEELALRVYLHGHDLAALCDDLFKPAMEEIGNRGKSGGIDIYHEHRATQMMFRVLGRLRAALRPPAEHDPVALGASPQGDPYGLATLMAELVLLGGGWRPVNLGPDTPLSSIERAIADLRPKLVWLSVSAPVAEAAFAAAVGGLSTAAGRHGAGVIVGGRGLTASLRGRLRVGATGDCMQHLGGFAQAISRRARPAPVDLLAPRSLGPDSTTLH